MVLKHIIFNNQTTSETGQIPGHFKSILKVFYKLDQEEMSYL